MDFKRYCPHCGSHVETEYGVTQYTCADCKTEMQFKDLVPGWTLDARYSQLKAMHDLMCEANDESIYMTWITIGVPDCPSEKDFIEIALDSKAYNECFDLFVKLIKKDGNRW